MAEKTFDQMNATEKTAFLGFRSYSQKEQKIREKETIKRGSELTVVFLQELLKKEDVVISKYLTEEQREANYKTAINTVYDYAFNNGYSLSDLESVEKNLVDLAIFTQRLSNYASGEYFKLAYAITGENKFEYASLKKIADITAVAKDTFPKDAIIEDDVEEVKVDEAKPVVDEAQA